MKITKEHFSKAIAIITIVVSLLVLIGWIFNIPVLKSILPQWPATKFNTAIGLLLSGITLYLLNKPSISLTEKKIAQLFASFILIIGLLTLSQYLFGYNTGIDELFWKDDSVVATYPGRISLLATINFMVLGIVFLLLPNRKFHLIVQITLLLMIPGLTQVFLNYTFGTSILQFIPQSTFAAFHGVILFPLLVIGIILSTPLSYLNFSFKKKIIGFFALVILMMFLIFSAIKENQQQIIDSSKLVDHTRAVIIKSGKLLDDGIDIESESRGFVFTGDEKFLESYTMTVKSITEQLKAFRVLTIDNPRHQLKIDSLEIWIKKRNDFSALLFEVRKTGGFDEAHTLIQTERGKFYTNKIKRMINDLQQDENNLSEKYKAVNQQNIENSKRAVIVFQIIIGMVLLIIILIIRKNTLARNKTEEKYKKSEQYNRTLFDQNPVGIALAGMDGSLVDVNNAYAAIIGRTIEEIRLLTYWDITPVKYTEQEQQQLKSLNTIGNYGPYEKEYIHKDGHLVPVSLQGLIIEKNNEKYILSSVEDITERKKAEQEIKSLNETLEIRVEKKTEELVIANKELAFQNEELERANQEITGADMLFSLSLDMLFIATGEYFTKINPAFINILGHDKKNLLGKRFLSFIHPDDVQATVDEMVKLQQGIPTICFVNRLHCKDNSYRWFTWTVSSDRQTGLLYGVGHDITEQTKAEEAIQKLTERLTIATTSAKIGIWDWDMVNDILLWDERMIELLGIEKGSVINNFETWQNILHPEDTEKMDKALKEAIEGNDNFNMEFRILRPDQSVRFLYSHGHIIKDEQGNALRMLGVNWDITEQKKAALKLAESENHLRTIIQSNPECIKLLNQKNELLQMNPAGLAMIEADNLEQVQGNSIMGVINPQYKKAFEKINRDVFKGIPGTLEFEITGLKGTHRWLDTHAVPMKNDKGEIISLLAITRDITERKKIETELIQAKKLAEQSVKTKEIFLANMSHEIRTPMNAIIGMSEILQDNNLTLDQEECVNAIKLSADNLLSIINDILDFSKIEAGKVLVKNLPFKLEELLEGIMQTLHFTTDKESITLTYTISNEIPKVIIGDSVHLRQILLNLASNSIKFTKVGNVNIDIQLENLKDDICTLIFKVTDTGIGIPSDKLSSIFESFTQVSSDINRKYGGTGLGLAITKQLVELHGGTISVSSEPNKGSCFFFTLPFRKGDAESIPIAIGGRENDFSYSEVKGLKILVVEDNLMNQLLAKKILMKWDCQFDIADNGRIAVDKLSTTDYDIILMDIQMPEMDGIEATKHIRTTMSLPTSQIPIIAMTANALVGEAEKYIAIGMNDYISKPFSQKVLYEKIIQWTGKNKQSAPD